MAYQHWEAPEIVLNKREKSHESFYCSKQTETRHLQQHGSYQDHQKYTSQKALGLFNNSKKRRSFEWLIT